MNKETNKEPLTPEMWERLTRSSIHQIRWTHEQYKRANKPLVYVFWADTERKYALYVGKSKNGLSRPMDPAHHRHDAVAGAAMVEFLICESNVDAEALEIRLIRWLSPAYNVAGNAGGPRDIRKNAKLKNITPIIRKALEKAARRDTFFKE